MISFFLFSVMLLLQFLEVCIGGTFDLWPAYVQKILFSASSTPENIRTLAAYFYGHDVPLGVASTTYTICNPTEKQTTSSLVLWGYYANFYSRRNTRHLAQYFDVQHGLLMWVNGLPHHQLEPVLPNDQITPPLNCKPLRHCPTPSYAELAYSK